MQEQKISMRKRKFRIGDLAQELKLKKYIIRFWEKEFDLRSDRSEGGQRFYTQDDFELFCTIKDLLYNKGFTIAGAKKQLFRGVLEDGCVESVTNSEILTEVLCHQRPDDQVHPAHTDYSASESQEKVLEQIRDLKQNLLSLRRLLD